MSRTAPNLDGIDASSHLLTEETNNGGEEIGRLEGTRSIYALSRNEIARGVANRIVHSRTYIYFYLGMAGLSVATVVLSLTDGCPGLAFYILEIIINVAMILEVVIRFVALGKQFWKSPFNVVDLILTGFCALTLLVLFLADCATGSKEEEIFDTLLLVARNVLQFGRLASVMRQSGQSIFSRPKLIDINAARRTGAQLDLGMESDEDAELGLGRGVVFDAGAGRRTLSAMPHAVRAVETRDEEDLWASL